MKTITLIGQKGGTGKTTMTLALAVAAVQSGFSAVIIDTDPQQSALNWKKRRKEGAGPVVVACDADRLAGVLKECRKNGADYVFIDTPGKLADRPGEITPAAIKAAKAADLVLIPVRQQIFEIETIAPARDVIKAAGNPRAAVIINGAHPNTRNPADAMRQLVAGAFGLPVASAYLCHRHAFAAAPATGQGPQESEPDSRAAEEAAALFSYVHNATNPESHNMTERTAANG